MISYIELFKQVMKSELKNSNFGSVLIELEREEELLHLNLSVQARFKCEAQNFHIIV